MTWLRLVIPLAIGVVAAFLNWTVLTGKDPEMSFVRVKEPIKAGSVFEESSLEAVSFSGKEDDLKQLVRTAVPYTDRWILYNKTALRDLDRNDLVLLRDTIPARGELKQPALPVSLEGLHVVPELLQVGDDIGFLIARRPSVDKTPAKAETKVEMKPEEDPILDLVGPFRVLSVGNLVGRLGLEYKEGRGQSERLITVAVKLGPDRKLDDANVASLLAAQKEEGGNRSRVYGLVLMPNASTPSAPTQPKK